MSSTLEDVAENSLRGGIGRSRASKEREYQYTNYDDRERKVLLQGVYTFYAYRLDGFTVPRGRYGRGSCIGVSTRRVAVVWKKDSRSPIIGNVKRNVYHFILLGTYCFDIKILKLANRSVDLRG